MSLRGRVRRRPRRGGVAKQKMAMNQGIFKYQARPHPNPLPEGEGTEQVTLWSNNYANGPRGLELGFKSVDAVNTNMFYPATSVSLHLD